MQERCLASKTVWTISPYTICFIYTNSLAKLPRSLFRLSFIPQLHPFAFTVSFIQMHPHLLPIQMLLQWQHFHGKDAPILHLHNSHLPNLTHNWNWWICITRTKQGQKWWKEMTVMFQAQQLCFSLHSHPKKWGMLIFLKTILCSQLYFFSSSLKPCPSADQVPLLHITHWALQKEHTI